MNMTEPFQVRIIQMLLTIYIERELKHYFVRYRPMWLALPAFYDSNAVCHALLILERLDKSFVLFLVCFDNIVGL